MIGVFGVITTFNVVFLLMRVLTAYATFLLARHVTGHVAESWLAGALFAWSPLLIARGTEHFSLVAAAPLAIFLLVLLKADGHERFRDAVALGVTEWLAASTDVYYAGTACSSAQSSWPRASWRSIGAPWRDAASRSGGRWTS